MNNGGTVAEPPGPRGSQSEIRHVVPQALYNDAQFGRTGYTAIRHKAKSDKASRARRRLLLIACGVGCLAVAFAVWPWTPLGDVIDLRALVALITGIEQSLMGIVGLIALFLMSALIFLPITPLILLTMLAFGPAAGGAWSLVGILCAAQAGFWLGRWLGHRDLMRLRSDRIYRLSSGMRDRGLLKTMILRVLPVAHFTAVSFALGASHLRWSDYILGTLLGSGLTVSIIGLLFERTAAAMRTPSTEAFAILAALTVVLVVLLIVLQRRGRALLRQTGERT